MRWAICVVTIVSLASGIAHAQRAIEQHLGSAVLSSADDVSASDLAELAQVIGRRGYSVNLDPLCSAIEVDHLLKGCQFRQVSVGLKTGDGDILAFNVPAGANTPPFVIVFHLAREIGEIYLVSMSGGLVKAYAQVENGNFALMKSADAKQRFLIDMAYWARNVASIYDHLGIDRPPHRQ